LSEPLVPLDQLKGHDSKLLGQALNHLHDCFHREADEQDDLANQVRKLERLVYVAAGVASASGVGHFLP